MRSGREPGEERGHVMSGIRDCGIEGLVLM